MEPSKPPTPADAGNSLPVASVSEDTPHVRTYASDLAKMIEDKKLSQQDLQKMDPALVNAVKQFQTAGTTVARPQVNMNSSPVLVQPWVRNIAVPKNGDVPEKVLDMSVDEDKVSAEKTAETLTAVSQKLTMPIAPIVPSPSMPIAPVKGTPAPVAVPVTAPIVAPESPAPVAFPNPNSSLASTIASALASKPEIKPEPIPEAIPEPMPELAPRKREFQIGVPLAERLKSQEESLETKVAEIKSKKEELENREKTLQNDEMDVRAKIQPLKDQEKELEIKEKVQRQKERGATNVTDKRDSAKERWTIEDERQRIERERWDIDQKITDMDKELREVAKEKTQINSDEQKLEKTLDGVKQREAALMAQEDKKDLLKKIEEIHFDRSQLEGQWRELTTKLQAIKDQKSIITKQESVLENEIQTLETQEHKAGTTAEEHAIETKRWEKDAELRTVEEKEWAMADDEANETQALKDIEQKSQEVLHNEKELKDKLAELEAIIAKAKAIVE